MKKFNTLKDLPAAKLTLELLRGKGSLAKLTLSIIERAIAAYRNGGES